MPVKQNQKGFSALHAILVLFVIGVLGFAGWRVYEARKEDASSTKKTHYSEQHDEESAIHETYTIPDGYSMYENKELGFSFAYPEAYGDISAQPDENGVGILGSSEPAESYGPGVHGSLKIFTYPTASQEITARKYGPKIRLQNGKWIVTQANELDTVGNKVGDEYRDQDKIILEEQDNDGLIVYTQKSSDEGTDNVSLLFVANDRLHQLHLPQFSDGTYANVDQNAQPNDKARFNELIKGVRDSVRAYE